MKSLRCVALRCIAAGSTKHYVRIIIRPNLTSRRTRWYRCRGLTEPAESSRRSQRGDGEAQRRPPGSTPPRNEGSTESPPVQQLPPPTIYTSSTRPFSSHRSQALIPLPCLSADRSLSSFPRLLVEEQLNRARMVTVVSRQGRQLQRYSKTGSRLVVG